MDLTSAPVIPEQDAGRSDAGRLVGADRVLAILAEIIYVLGRGSRAFQLAAPAPPAQAGNVELVADVLFKQYLVPFELASILLLAAIVGSVIMARKRV